MTTEEAIAEAREAQAKNQTIEPCITRRLLHCIDALTRENAELRHVFGRARAWLKREGYKATSDSIREIDAVLKPKP